MWSKAFTAAGTPSQALTSEQWKLMGQYAALEKKGKGKKAFVLLEDFVAAMLAQDGGNNLRNGYKGLVRLLGPVRVVSAESGRNAAQQPSLLYQRVPVHWYKAMGFTSDFKGPAFGDRPADGKLRGTHVDILETWFMIDASKGDSLVSGISGGAAACRARLDKANPEYAPFGPEFPMKWLEALFLAWPRQLFHMAFLPQQVLEQGVGATEAAAHERLRQTFRGVFEADLKMSVRTLFNRDNFEAAATQGAKGAPLRVLNAAVMSAMDLLLRAAASGAASLTQMYGDAAAVEAEHIRREQMFAEHWSAFRKMWIAYYKQRAAQVEREQGGESDDADAADGDDAATGEAGDAGTPAATAGMWYAAAVARACSLVSNMHVGACKHVVGGANMHVGEQHAC